MVENELNIKQNLVYVHQDVIVHIKVLISNIRDRNIRCSRLLVIQFFYPEVSGIIVHRYTYERVWTSLDYDTILVSKLYYFSINLALKFFGSPTINQILHKKNSLLLYY